MKLYLYFRWELGGADLKFHGNCKFIVSGSEPCEDGVHLEIVIVSIFLGW